jgi:hypothetical protein
MTARASPRLAGAELLGRDVAAICEPQLLNQLRSFLTSEPDRERLARHLVLGYQTERIAVRPWTETDISLALVETARVANAWCRGLMHTR